MNILSASGLTKSFGGVVAVNDLTFSVEKGTIFGIIGPNGAGKTSLFNLLTGFLKADAGSVLLDDSEILGLKPYRIVEIGLARSFQIVKPFLGLTVRDTLEIASHGPRIRRRHPDASRQRGLHEDILRGMDLLEKADSLVDDLNQGELRLLDIARALSTEPEVLLLDEPFSGLGHQHVTSLSDILLSLRHRGVTVVIIEHRLRELMRLVDRVMAINFGRKLAEGAPAEIVRNSDVVEAYLGTKRGGLELAQD